MQQIEKILMAARNTVDGVSGGTAVKPQRSRAKPELPKGGKPDNAKPEPKKGAVPRRAPSRGKYIDEYARPGV
jgi:hypothetical protein